MRGDAVQVEEPHTRLAQKLVSILLKRISYQDRRFVISIAGESGSGKSETAVALDTALSAHGVSSIVLQQDDYFVGTPNAVIRIHNVSRTTAYVPIEHDDDNPS